MKTNLTAVRKILTIVVAVIIAVALCGAVLKVQGATTAPTVGAVPASTVYQAENGNIITEYKDGSWSAVNEEKALYVFQPVELGDWDYHTENREQLSNLITTYYSNK